MSSANNIAINIICVISIIFSLVMILIPITLDIVNINRRGKKYAEYVERTQRINDGIDDLASKHFLLTKNEWLKRTK